MDKHLFVRSSHSLTFQIYTTRQGTQPIYCPHSNCERHSTRPFARILNLTDHIRCKHLAESTLHRRPSTNTTALPLTYTNRTYHSRPARGTLYPLPIDETELGRQGALHALYKDTLYGYLYLAPVKDALRVLDLGTGRGHWAYNFALRHPEAKVYGTDLSPIQMTSPRNNCFFQVDDFEEEWTWVLPFDFVHGRDLLPAVGNWPRLLEQAFRHLQPGGYIELQYQVFPLCCDESPTHSDLVLLAWSGRIMEIFARQPYNIRLGAAAEIEDLLKNAGFVNVHKTRFRWDLHARTNDQQKKKFSQKVRENLLEGLDAYSRRPFFEGGSQSYTQYDASLVRVRRAIENEANCVYVPVDVVYARKPSLDDGSVGIVAKSQQTEIGSNVLPGNSCPPRADQVFETIAKEMRTDGLDFLEFRNLEAERAKPGKQPRKIWHCTHTKCIDENGIPIRFFKRLADRDRHLNSCHGTNFIDCPFGTCTRKGKNGFTRKDNLLEHLHMYHKLDKAAAKVKADPRKVARKMV